MRGAGVSDFGLSPKNNRIFDPFPCRRKRWKVFGDRNKFEEKRKRREVFGKGNNVFFAEETKKDKEQFGSQKRKGAEEK